MPAWKGGPCPGCSEEVPPKVLRCPTCRTLLDPDLSAHEFDPPEFAPLAEVDGPAIVRPKAERTRCPGCGEELRIATKYAGVPVACKKCGEPMTAGDAERRVALLADCPHCLKEIRVGMKYVGQLVGCKLCGGELMVAERGVS
ncbi:zinc ribbon domain-containing protein [Alienimonas californiensis]|uniref:Double zinc ribbon n=1 Tax=Alienimonas californiensis TaxID=2527989 RepID=A0A517PF75_9PLAN|nr:zinc ribbon domain-containing protein [Alienimonas californiensis]QDT18037.1 Double zinc ribbon [Alienimonas californiensis]